MSGLISAFSFVLLFYYDWKLALLATGLSLVLVLAIALTSYLQLGHQRVLGAIGGRLSGLVLELINGVSKFRVAGAEARAFAYWAGEFAGQRRVSYRARSVNNALLVFNAAFPVVTSMAVFAAMMFWLDPKPSIGSFLGFNSAFTQFITGVLAIGTACATVIQIVPLFERARPILEALPEADENKADPGELSGAIELNNVSFRYLENGPPVLDDISLQIRPGEFVALVGPSGSGKSTLLRLLLAFDAPEAGAILYDGRDLASLDPRGVRRQIGSVLQNGRLMSGNVFENIVGSSTLTMDDAWEAARMAGLDEDIRQMPMEMQTVISEGGGTLSGGQRQRLLIARAIVHRPRIVFFDEATSALDNRTQEIVSKSLEGLAATRVVIAHRLSTIVNADRIYVLQNGRIVESGTYRELMQRRGLFSELARRQIA
jgi:ATP-binding cassette subfamily C protein